MEPKLKQKALDLTEEIMRMYYSQRNVNFLLDLLSPIATWIGPGEQEKKYSIEEICSYIRQGEDKVPSCTVLEPDLHAIELGKDYCLVTGSMIINTNPESGIVLEVDQRVSFVYHYSNGIFRIVHMHISNPYGEMESNEFFPHKLGNQSYKYLQKLLSEKSEIIDMITGNINGGLKGSIDDDKFTYFYVNDGLPQMLGYTYDEFMEKSGGSAVGACYPPDLPSALDDCTKWFEKGNVYFSEYRMEKKDGSLMWVLDSGRKMVDSDGNTRINSIITDITPLKQAQFELELERERYRIALEHITGAMCEYDIISDVFTLYKQTDNNDFGSIDKLEIADFSKAILSGELISIEDGEKFLFTCTNKTNNSMEFLTTLPYNNGNWYWMQFSCSIVSDHGGEPVRAIGMLQDITERKERNIELLDKVNRDGLTGILNQTATKDIVENYLENNQNLSILKNTMLMIDLDHFKNINDFNGHLYGDHVLIETARILKKVFAQTSIIGRVGGDEFLVFVKDGNGICIKELAEKVIKEIREIGKSKDFSISCSIGIAHRNAPKENFTLLFEKADRALYNAKNSGRNCFYID